MSSPDRSAGPVTDFSACRTGLISDLLPHPSFRPGPRFREGPFTRHVEGAGSMAEQDSTQAGLETEPEQREPPADEPTLHLASGEDETKARRQGDLFDAILARGDLRDQAAVRRDRRAEGRASTPGDAQAGIDRIWSGLDRDAAAADRATLVALLHAQQEPGRTTRLIIDEAKGILIARDGCTPEVAFLALSTAAAQNGLRIDEMATCLVANRDLR